MRVAAKTNNSSARSLIVSLVLLVVILAPDISIGDEFWAIPLARGKGDDYLFVVNPAKALKPPLRRLRCTESLPLYVEKLAKAASRIDGVLLLRVEAEIVPENISEGHRTEKLKIKMVCLTPKSSCPILAEMKSWKDYPQSLPQPPMIENPVGPIENDPFGFGATPGPGPTKPLPREGKGDI